MSNWYISSVAYAAISAFQVSHAYSVGDIVRPTAAGEGRKQAYRCTTAGTSAGSEGSWTGTFGGTTTQGTAVFTAIGGDTYGWSAALGDIKTGMNISTSGYGSIGDNFYLSSDHSETTSTSLTMCLNLVGLWGTSTTHFISVNRAGSVPPVAADVTAGATITNGSGTAGVLIFEAISPIRYEGITFIQAASNYIWFNNSRNNSTYFKNCALKFTTTGSSFTLKANNPGAVVTFDNTPITFGATSQGIQLSAYGMEFKFINGTLLGAGSSIPTALITGAVNTSMLATFRGVDMSGFTGTLFATSSTAGPTKILLESCKISSSMTIVSGTPTAASNEIELVNCWDGTNVLNTRVTGAGTVSTERTIVLTGGAADDIGGLSFKMASGSTRVDKYVAPLDCFYFDVENTATGSSKTATIEINASATLNNDEVWMRLEYMGTSGNPLTSFVDTLPASVVTGASNLSTSAATWGSDPATPVHQKLTATFTPQRAGRVRAQVYLGKPSTTIYVNPQITIS